MEKKMCTAIVLSAGQGKRMGTTVQKQYLKLAGRPVLFYSLSAFQKSSVIDEIVLVSGAGQTEYCKKEIVQKYGFDKVTAVVEGGAERYDSVLNGLQAVGHNGYVFIHDGARPFVDEEILKRTYECVVTEKACVVGMPVKDTIKIADADGFCKETPDRKFVWMVQTPQAFAAEIAKTAYREIMKKEHGHITDDAMVVEETLGLPVKFVEGSYENIKITTPEDLDIANVFLQKRKR